MTFYRATSYTFCFHIPHDELVGLVHGLAGSANADFTFVIVSQGEMADAMGFSVE
jgi:hypothetical protein